jgi:hypothetical protein
LWFSASSALKPLICKSFPIKRPSFFLTLHAVLCGPNSERAVQQLTHLVFGPLYFLQLQPRSRYQPVPHSLKLQPKPRYQLLP